MTSIYKIHKELENLFLEIPETGEMTDEQVVQYENLGIELAEKQKNTLLFYRDLELTEELIDSEIERLKALKTQAVNKQTAIMRLVEYGMDKLELNELDFGSIKAVRKLNPPRVVIDESKELPSEYTRQKIIIEPDKIKIKEALKSGLQVEGAQLQQESRIEIK